MIRNVILIGNSGAALECYTLLKDVLNLPSFRTIFRFKGFLSHKGYKGHLGEYASFELGSDANYTPQLADVFLLGIGNNDLRFTAYTQMKEKGGEFINLISPYSFIGDNVIMGEGNIIKTGCSISNNSTLGNANYLNGNIIIGHDVHMGDANFFGTNSMVFGNTSIGRFNSFAPASMLMEKAKVGNNNKIAPASVLYKGCRDNCLMAGNPALKITEL